MSLLEIDDTFQRLLGREYAGNSVERWLIALAILIGSFLALGIAKRLIQARLGHLAAKTETDLDDLLVDLIKRTKRFFLFALACWIASHFVLWPGADTDGDKIADRVTNADRWIESALKVAFWLQVGFWGRGLVDYGISRLVRTKDKDASRAMGATVLGFIGQVVVWSIVLLACIESTIGNVTSLMASLGVGGIAVALALQNVLGDLFASIAILLDKPFVVGDGIVVGDFTGTVERIGVKTTRLRSVNGEEIIMGNHDLVASRIRNFKRLEERRLVLALSLDYDTPTEVVERVPEMIREIVGSVPKTRFERAHFRAFGDSGLLFEAVYFSLDKEYAAMMDTQQAVNVKLLHRFDAERISFAFPTQTVRHVNLVPAAPPIAASAAEQAVVAKAAQNELSRG